MLNDNYKIYAFYVLIASVIFFPLLIGSATIIWDGISLWLPWKHFIVEELLNGFLPLWNPFHNGGFPQHADSMTWYPISWVFGFLFGRYTIYSINLEYLFHVSLAGYSFYCYSARFSSNQKLRFYLGLCYMFSGFILGNSQHISYIINAAWFPFVLLYLNKMKHDGRPLTIVCFSLTTYFFFSGGYLAIFFISLYLLFFYVVSAFLSLEKTQRKYYLYRLLIACCLLIVLALPILYSTVNLFHFFERSEGINESVKFNYGSMPWNGLYSIFLPFSSGIFNASEIEFGFFSAFLGTLPIVLVLFKIKEIIKRKELLAILIVSLFFLFASMGEIFKIRNLIASLPLMNLFKFPSIFRLFFIFYFLTLVSKLAHFDVSENNFAKLKKVSLFLIVPLLTIVFYLLLNDTEIEAYFKHLLVNFSVLKLSLLARIKINLAVILIGLFLFLVFSNRINFKKVLLRLAIIELLVVACLAGPHIVYFNLDVPSAHNYIKIQPESHPQLLKTHSKNELDEWDNYTDFSWQAKTFYIKQWSKHWFNPLKLKANKQKNNLSFFKTNYFDSSTTVVTVWQQQQDKLIPVHENKPRIWIQNNQAFILKTTPLKLKNAYIVLRLNNYKEWIIKQNGKTIQPLKAASSIFVLPYKNSSNYKFSYKKQPYIVLFWLGTSLLLLLIIVYLFYTNNRLLKFSLISLVALICLSSIYTRKKMQVFPANKVSIITDELLEDDLKILSEDYWENLKTLVFIPRNIPKTQLFFSCLQYYYPIKLGYTKRNNKLYEVRKKRSRNKKTIFKETYDTLRSMPVVALTKEAKKKSFFNTKPIGISVTYQANDSTNNTLWLVHYKNNQHNRAITIPLKSSLGNTTEKKVIYYLDLSSFSFAYQDELRMFVWGGGINDPLLVRKVELFYD